MKGRVASFAEIARICREARSAVLRGAGGLASPDTNHGVLSNQGPLRKIAAESTRRLKAAGIHIEGA